MRKSTLRSLFTAQKRARTHPVRWRWALDRPQGAFVLQQYAGRSAQAQRANPGRENKAMHEVGEAGRERPATRLRPRKDKG